MGVLFVASLFIVRLNREWHVEALMARAGKGGPMVAGAAFAIAWTPCIGPTLGGDPDAAGPGTAAHGALLLAVYSAGLGNPVPGHGARLLTRDHRVRRRQAPLRADHRGSAAGS